jgi:hypothetical protein
VVGGTVAGGVKAGMVGSVVADVLAADCTGALPPVWTAADPVVWRSVTTPATMRGTASRPLTAVRQKGRWILRVPLRYVIALLLREERA